ncbi:MAG TPA: DUF4843 domain-containing protein [Pedobacter sp.]
MSKIKYISLFGLVLCLFTACKKDNLLTYDKANSADNIYFNYAPVSGLIDSAAVSFAYSAATVKDSVFKIPVAITGSPADHDRTYSITVVSGSTTAAPNTNYVLPSTFIVRKGLVQDTLAVKLLRTTDLQTKALSLDLALQPGGDFQTGIQSKLNSLFVSINVLSFKISFSDLLGPGTYWTNIFQAYFGAFSIKKVKLMNQAVGLPLNYWTTGWLTDLSLAARCTTWAIAMSHYLADQAAAGHPVYEDDGLTLMVMAPNYQ